MNQTGTLRYLPEENRDIVSSIDSARRGALVREISLAEEPTESAAKEHQYVRNHWTEECRERYQSMRRGRLEPEVGEGFRVSSLKNS